MTNMHELSTLKNFLILAHLHVPAHKPAHPVIGDYCGREHFQLAARFQGRKGKKHQLLCDVDSTFSCIGPGKKFRVVKPDEIYTVFVPSMNPKFIANVRTPDFYCLIIDESVSDQVVSLFFLIILVIRGDNVHYFSQLY